MKPSGKITVSAMLEKLDVRLMPEAAFGVVNRFYKSQGDKSKAKRGELVVAVYHGDLLAGVMRLLPKTEGWYLMRSVCVTRDLRARGIGSFIVEKGLQNIDVKGCYCFALPHLDGFYRRLGFQHAGGLEAALPLSVSDDIRRIVQQAKPWLPMVYVKGEVVASL